MIEPRDERAVRLVESLDQLGKNDGFESWALQQAARLEKGVYSRDRNSVKLDQFLGDHDDLKDI